MNRMMQVIELILNNNKLNTTNLFVSCSKALAEFVKSQSQRPSYLHCKILVISNLFTKINSTSEQPKI